MVVKLESLAQRIFQGGYPARTNVPEIIRLKKTMHSALSPTTVQGIQLTVFEALSARHSPTVVMKPIFLYFKYPRCSIPFYQLEQTRYLLDDVPCPDM